MAGEFPWQNLLTDGHERTSPVKSFPPNGYGLFDVAGNVWEWTADRFTPRHTARSNTMLRPRNPRVTEPDARVVATHPTKRFPRKVIKGGSHLCAPNYCLRYRPAARSAETIETSTGHIGFRCVIRNGRT